MKIKFNKYHVTDGLTKARVWYSIGNRADKRNCVTLYAKDYDRRLGNIFKDDYENESDIYTDYFDQGRVVIFEDNPLYESALKRAEQNKFI